MHDNRSLLPALVTILGRGYRLADFRRDLAAGLTVAIVALPLAMALAIASGAPPEKGLHTAIIAGLLISVLGGSRVQIGGPTGAFIPVVFAIIALHGYDGLLLATLMAGLILVVAAWARVGTLMKYMPQPVITGFTAGIAVIIFTSQIKELLGLDLAQVPAEFVPKLLALGQALPSLQGPSLLLAALSVTAIVVLRRYAPRWPAFLLVVAAAAVCTALLALPVDTLGSRFGGVPSALPSLELPDVSLGRLWSLLPAAFTIAFLAGIESLLSAVVADGMIGEKHRPNAELMAQGVANMGSALFGGLPATGAIARTATNVRSGAVSPLAGIFHALFILLCMATIAPLLAHIPLAALAAVLVIVAWNMSEHERFRHLLRAPPGDRLVLLVSFGLTILVDLTVAIEVGLVLAAFLFMHRMAQSVEMAAHDGNGGIEEHEFGDPLVTDQRTQLPEGVAAFQIQGPLFFGAASRLDDVPRQFGEPPRVFILRMSMVPLIDASGAHALQGFLDHWRRHDTLVILSGLRPGPERTLARLGMQSIPGQVLFVPSFEAALALAEEECRSEPE